MTKKKNSVDNDLSTNLRFNISNAQEAREVFAKNLDVSMEKINSLTEKEFMYLTMMCGRSGVLYLKAKPGVGKSALGRSIAEKLDWNYFDVRLAMVDETDVGLFPNVLTFEENGESVRVLEHIVPLWAYRANERRTLIHFEELNRASLPVRNAALQILLERGIGIDFKFNDGVIMMASGNLGEADSTDVEEFDSALRNRLITYEHTLSVDEWIENFAKDNMHPDIVLYIKNNPEKSYVNPSENADSYATFRSWHFLSEFLKNFSELDAEGNVIRWVKDTSYLGLVQNVGRSYVGDAIIGFLRYIEDNIRLNINDVLNHFPEVKDQLKLYGRDKFSELISSLREKDLTKLSKNQIQNIIDFLKIVDEDEQTAYILSLFDNENVDIEHENVLTVIKPFDDIVKKITDIDLE